MIGGPRYCVADSSVEVDLVLADDAKPALGTTAHKHGALTQTCHVGI